MQLLDEYYDTYIRNINNKNININTTIFNGDDILSMEKMKEKSIQLLFALDNNIQAQGRILLDDFTTTDTKKKRNLFIK